jgi:hypothetical protein
MEKAGCCKGGTIWSSKVREVPLIYTKVSKEGVKTLSYFLESLLRKVGM